MCGRVFIKSSLDGLMDSFAFAQRAEAQGMDNSFPRWNGSPGVDYPIIVWEHDIHGPAFIRAMWGFIPSWMKEQHGPRPPPNARSETVATNGMFKHAYRSRRALIPVEGYFEWQDVHSTGKNKKPYALAMADDQPFAIAAIWETWRNPETGEDTKTFAVLTCEPNEMVATIHDRMPVILDPKDYQRWLGGEEDPRDLLKPFPADRMKMWPVGKAAGNVRNNTPDILNEVVEEGNDQDALI